MADLIMSVVVDVLGHIAIQNLQRSHVEGIAPIDSFDLVVLDASEFGVLEPQIGFNADFRRGKCTLNWIPPRWQLGISEGNGEVS